MSYLFVQLSDIYIYITLELSYELFMMSMVGQCKTRTADHRYVISQLQSDSWGISAYFRRDCSANSVFFSYEESTCSEIVPFMLKAM